MKTQTEMAMVMLVLIVAAVIALTVWSGSQVEVAAAQVNAEVATGKLPMAAMIGGEMAGWALKTLIGVIVLAIATGIAAWVRQWWKSQNSKRAWRKGPNAKWQGQERAPRPISEADFMRAILYQQMMQNSQRRQTTQTMPLDDELDIDF